MFFRPSETVLIELGSLTQGKPDLGTERGDLFISTQLPAACIRLKIPLTDFLRHVLDLPEFTQTFKVLPVKGRSFDIVILGGVTIADGLMAIDGKRADLL